MMVFSILGLLVVYKQQQPYGWDMLWPRHFMQILLYALIFAVGLFRMSPSRSGGKKLSFGAMLLLYKDSWEQLWRHKWILWLFGGWGFLNLAGSLAQYSITSRAIESRRALLASRFGSHLGIDWARALDAIPGAAYRRWGPWFSAQAGPGGFILAGVFLLVAAIWLHRRLTRLRSEPQYASGAGWLQALLLPIAISWIGAAVGVVEMQMALYRSMIASTRTFTVANPLASGAAMMPQIVGPGSAVFGGKRNLIMDFLPMFESIYLIFLAGVLFAGLAGSLKRLRSSQPVTVDSFVKSVVVFWRPLVGVSLLLALAEYSFLIVPYLGVPFLDRHVFGPYREWGGLAWNFFVPALMLVPFAVVIYGAGAFRAIGLGLRDFFSNTWDAVSFIALGLTIVSIPIFCQELLRQVARLHSGFATYAAVATGSTAITVLTTAFVSVAIWGFYCQMGKCCEPRVVTAGIKE
jgi:hypothetical protein